MLLDLSIAPPLPPANLLTSSPLEMAGEIECDLQAFLNIWQMSACLVCILWPYKTGMQNI